MVMTSIVAFVSFKSELSLSEISKVISERLLGGIPFAGAGTGIRDEVLAVRLQSSILGSEVVLYGYGGEDGYCLEIQMVPSWRRKLRESGLTGDRLDISDFLGDLLETIEVVTVTDVGQVDLSGEVDLDL